MKLSLLSLLHLQCPSTGLQSTTTTSKNIDAAIPRRSAHLNLTFKMEHASERDGRPSCKHVQGSIRPRFVRENYPSNTHPHKQLDCTILSSLLHFPYFSILFFTALLSSLLQSLHFLTLSTSLFPSLRAFLHFSSPLTSRLSLLCSLHFLPFFKTLLLFVLLHFCTVFTSPLSSPLYSLHFSTLFTSLLSALLNLGIWEFRRGNFL